MTEEEKRKRAEYMREYNRKNKERINAQRRLKRADLSEKDLEAEREKGRIRNRKYYSLNKEDIISRAKAKNWNYTPEKGHTKRMKHYAKNPWSNILRARKSSATKKGLPFEITEEWFKNEWQKGCCMTGKAFDDFQTDSPWVAHIDRIVPGLGYTFSNCRLVCACFNLAKKHWTDEDVLEMARLLTIRTSDV